MPVPGLQDGNHKLSGVHFGDRRLLTFKAERSHDTAPSASSSEKPAQQPIPDKYALGLALSCRRLRSSPMAGISAPVLSLSFGIEVIVVVVVVSIWSSTRCRLQA